MKIFCTLFDSSYLTRGLACYESLINQNIDFHIYIFAFDDLSYSILTKLNLNYVTTISLKDFEDEKLLKVKGTRSVAEYCWTCTPSIICYVLSNYGHDHCTYIDADTYFFKDPNLITENMGENSVLITPHFYSPAYDQTEISGIYCVQFMTFKNNHDGLRVLNWWREACIDWCFAEPEAGKFGDQKYLDDWPERFSGVYVTKNEGEGVAPWNIQQWSSKNSDKIIFYHFHALKLFKNYSFLGVYEFPRWVETSIYRPYIDCLKKHDLKLLSFRGYKSCFKTANLLTSVKHLFFERLKFKNNVFNY